jgi:hypothetical protein
MITIIHIGLIRTGTTALQRFLSGNRPALLSKGICYSSAVGSLQHLALTACAQDDHVFDPVRIVCGLKSVRDLPLFREGIKSSLEAEVLASRAHTLILSDEHMSYALVRKNEVERIKEIVQGVSDRICIILYLRRQDDLRESWYSTMVRTGAEYKLELPDDYELEARYNYQALIMLWESIFGRENIKVRRYDRLELVNGNTIDDFLDVTGLAPIEGSKESTVNASLDARTTEFLRLFNCHVPRIVDHKLCASRGEIAEVLEAISSRSNPRMRLSVAQRQRLMRQVRSSNAWVADRFFGGAYMDGDPLFGPDQHKDTSANAPFTAEDAVYVAAEIWRRIGVDKGRD